MGRAARVEALFRTGADGGGPVDVYIDEAIPGEVQERLVSSGGEFLLALSFPLGWKVALVITAVVFLGFFPARDWLLKRNARYQRLHNVVPVFRLKNQDPTLVLALRPIRDRAGLKGGSVSL